MGCFPAATGAIAWHARNVHKELEADLRKGGYPASTYREYALAPYEMNLSPQASADLEIRRALRIGLDGFAMDTWAGREGARDYLDTLFEVAEANDYPIELTICIDPNCLEKPQGLTQAVVDAIRTLLDRHGESPRLARRDGKPLIFGYQSLWPWVAYLHARHAHIEDPAERKERVQSLRASPEGWKLVGEAYRDIERRVGQPLYFHFCMSAFWHGLPGRARAELPPKADAQAAGTIARDLPAVGIFIWQGNVREMARAVLAQGAEWAHPFLLQYQNFGGYSFASKGTDWVHGQWAAARDWPSTLVQFITWNDYHENTNLAPGYNTRYAYYDLTAYFIRWWKTGRQPEPDRDRLYIFSRKYPRGARLYPFEARKYVDGAIEVLAILPRPARLRLIGRGAEWDAPAGLSRKQFPLEPGPVAVELVRDGEVAIRLECPEPVTDRPFRQDNGMTCISTEFLRHWRADFGEAEPFLYSEYGDADGDGLPNWFEMLWFGTFGDFSTATDAHPEDDPDGDGRTNLEEYLAQTDPTQAPPRKPPDHEPEE
ncbi:MAG: endo-1,3-alpha-glucanase family glycosylhydrolase [bacterium]